MVKSGDAHRGAMPQSPIAGSQGDPTSSGFHLTADEVNFAIGFTRVMSVLAKSTPYRDMPLGQVEHLIVPALLSGQFAILDAQIGGRRTPAAVAFWACVSAEVDARLSDTSISTVTIKPEDWRSGDILWLIDIAGQSQAILELRGQLSSKTFADQAVKMRHKADSGQITITILNQKSLDM